MVLVSTMLNKINIPSKSIPACSHFFENNFTQQIISFVLTLATLRNILLNVWPEYCFFRNLYKIFRATNSSISNIAAQNTKYSHRYSGLSCQKRTCRTLRLSGKCLNNSL